MAGMISLPILLLSLLLPAICPTIVAAAFPTAPLANTSIPFRVGLLLAKYAQKAAASIDVDGQQFLQFGDESETEEGKDLDGGLDGKQNCQNELANRLRAQLEGGKENLLNFGGNLLAQILAPGKREQICRIFAAQSAALTECIGQSASGGANNAAPIPIHPFHLILQSICGQFSEALDANGQCLSELQIGRLEGQCAQACQRQAAESSLPAERRPSNSNNAKSPALCQLALCSINCFGAQLSECAEEVEPIAGDPAKLKAMVDQLAGLQMLVGMQAQKGASPEFVQAMLMGASPQQQQMLFPMECAQFIGKAVTSANFVAPHDSSPKNGQQIPLERAKRALPN